MAFSWIPFYKEFAQKLLQFRSNRKPLVDWIYGNIDGSLIKHFKDAPDGRRVPDTDPFTVMAIFNRGITEDKRIDICTRFKEYLKIAAPVPQDFSGIPVMNTQRSNFMAFEINRKDGDIERLWNVFEDAVLNKDIKASYNALGHQYLIKFNLTIGLFWIRPDKYLPLDGNSQDLLNALGISFDKSKFLPYEEYVKVMHVLTDRMTSESLGFSDYAEFSAFAYQQKQSEGKPEKPQAGSSIAYWLYSPGEKASKWPQCTSEGIMCIGWDSLGDLTEYASREDMQKAIKANYPSDGSAKNDSLAVWQFANDIRPGDIVIAKKGKSKIVGRGIVTGNYEYNPAYGDFCNVRTVKWTHIGEWEAPHDSVLKTLTDITKYPEYVKEIESLFAPYEGKHYWWLVAKPKIWSLSEMKLDEVQDYTLYNDNGNQRRIFQNFLNAKEGDKVIGYEATPTKQIVAILEIAKANDGQSIWFKKKETLSTPINYAALKGVPELQNMEFFVNSNGSLFKLTENEFNSVMELIREDNPITPIVPAKKYTEEDFLKDVFVKAEDLRTLKSLLLRKKNLILQGAPGVGKTYAAKRLAYAIMGEVDDERIEQVQFHQNYSYEDFMMGYKPNDDGGFDMLTGVFYNYCKKATAADRDKPYFFIIDEINRGNLSKIFGELLMLIENDYRDKPIKLSYRDEKFAVPSNLHIIGMMNTADRSLAMIDYALRRRFSFFGMKPGFESEGFKNYLDSIQDSRLNKVVNAVIELNKSIESDDSLGSGFCIGHSYFCNLRTITDNLLADIVEYDIIPMLREYWFDNDNKFKEESQKLKDALK